MAGPHRNNVAARAALRPYDHDHSISEEAGADLAQLAIVEPVVDHRYRLAGKHLRRIDREIETPVRQGPVALDRIEGRFNGELCNYIMRRATSIM